MVGWWKIRRVGMIAVCAISVGVGTSLVWHLVPEALRQVRTAELLAVVGLFLLPVGTVFAFLMERQGRRGTVRGEGAGPAEVERVGFGVIEEPAGDDSAGAWGPVWEAVAAAPVVRHAGAGRREGGARRPGTDAGSRRRRETAAAAGAER